MRIRIFTSFSRCFVLLFLSLAYLTTLAQQSTGSIEGTVKTSDGQPAPLVSIRIQGNNRSTTVDEKGRYRFANVKPGTYSLIASFVGLKEQAGNVTVDDSGTATLDFILSENQQTLQEVVVIGSQRNTISDKKTEYVARMPLGYLENPQVYTVVSNQLLQQQMVYDYKDALLNAPGVVPSGSPAGSVGAILRGFSTETSVRNGLGTQNWTEIDPVNVERIEIIKGPSATLFGSTVTSFGGLINRVTKKPLDYFTGSVSATLGSYDMSRLTADINSPLNADKTVLFRVNTAYQKQNSFQNIGDYKSFVIAPTLSYQVNDRLKLTIDAELYNQTRSQDAYPISIPAGMISSFKDLPIPYKTSYGGKDINGQLSAKNIYAQAEYQLSDQWKSTTNVAYSNNHVDRSLQLYIAYQGGNSAARAVTDFGPRDFNSIQLQQNFIGDFHLGSLRNRLVAGIDYYTYHGVQRYSNQILYDIIPDVTQPFPSMRLDSLNTLAAKTKYTDINSGQDIISAYASDVLNITDRLDAMLSLRVDHFHNDPATTNGVKGTSDYSQTALSPKFGLVYQLVKDQVSVFGNYMNGFSNQGQAQGPNNTPFFLKPLQANQWEGGIKADAFDHRLSATVSYYNIKVSNATRQEGTAESGFYTVQDGTQRSKGFEAEITANPVDGLSLIAGYGHNENKYIRAEADLVGQFAQAAPQDVFNWWISYTFLHGPKGLGLAFGGNRVSKSYFTVPNTIEVPAYTLLNASIYYDQPKWRIGIKANNLGNEQYWNFYGAPQLSRQYLGTLTLKF